MNRLLVFLVVILAAATSAGAQSLADVAKKEEARRKEIKAPAKVLTNDDLKKYGTSTPPAAGATATAQPATTPDAASGQDAAKKPEAGDKAAAGEKPAEPEKNETWWRNRMTEARATLEKNKLLVDSLQTRANALVNDFEARDDPAQRMQLKLQREKTLAELQRVKDDIEAATKLIADIEEEARRAGVPPGWLR